MTGALRLGLNVRPEMDRSPENSDAVTSFSEFIRELRRFADSLPPTVHCTFEEDQHGVWFQLTPTDRRCRKLVIEASEGDLEYTLGRLWGESIKPTAEALNEVLAVCDSVRDRGFREVNDRFTGVRYHIFRYRSRGMKGYGRDSDYSLWHYPKLKVRRVQIRTVPPLVNREIA